MWSEADREENGSALVPLYLQKKDSEGSTFLSLPYSQFRSANGLGWQLVPPLFFREKNSGGSCLLTPLYSQGKSADGKESWNLLLPFFYSGRDGDEKFFTALLGGYRGDGKDKLEWMVIPLLTGGSKGPDRGELWVGCPFAPFQCG